MENVLKVLFEEFLMMEFTQLVLLNIIFASWLHSLCILQGEDGGGGGIF